MPIAGLYKIFDHWHSEGTVYIYSDPHFNDPDLKKGINRPDADELEVWTKGYFYLPWRHR